MTNAHHLIIIPVFHSGRRLYEFLTRKWSTKYGLTIYVVDVWATETDFSSMLNIVTNTIDRLSENGDSVSLVGMQAGTVASFARNLYSHLI